MRPARAMPDSPPAPTVTVHVPAPLRECCRGDAQLSLSARTVRDLLTEVERCQPTLYRGVCDETGQVRRHVNLFVNDTHIRDRNGLDTPLVEGDTLSILPAVSGG